MRAAGGDPGRVEGACERFELTGRLLRTTAAKLSAGQRRRVALAVLTARWPELWLLDEPHAGLDASARRILDALIAEAAAAGTTVVVASHEASSVEPSATRVVTMAGGRVTGERAVPGLLRGTDGGAEPETTGPAAPEAVPVNGSVAHVG